MLALEGIPNSNAACTFAIHLVSDFDRAVHGAIGAQRRQAELRGAVRNTVSPVVSLILDVVGRDPADSPDRLIELGPYPPVIVIIGAISDLAAQAPAPHVLRVATREAHAHLGTGIVGARVTVDVRKKGDIRRGRWMARRRHTWRWQHRTVDRTVDSAIGGNHAHARVTFGRRLHGAARCEPEATQDETRDAHGAAHAILYHHLDCLVIRIFCVAEIFRRSAVGCRGRRARWRAVDDVLASSTSAGAVARDWPADEALGGLGMVREDCVVPCTVLVENDIARFEPSNRPSLRCTTMKTSWVRSSASMPGPPSARIQRCTGRNHV